MLGFCMEMVRKFKDWWHRTRGIYDHIAWASGSPAPMPDGIAFMFAPAGVSPTNVGGPDLTDSSKDRIVVCNNGGQTVFGEPDSAYYKVK